MRLGFMGTPAFALPALTALCDAGHEICLVVTQPDRPAGRGRRVTPPPVKLTARERHLQVIQPVKVEEPWAVDALREAKPEAITVVAYGQLLPEVILGLPPHGCLNLHASLLPKFRGAAPIAWAIIREERVTGVTIMQIEPKMDAGPILLQQEEPIRPRDTAGTLGERLAVLGAALLCRAVDRVAGGAARPIPQDERLATYAPKLRPEDTRLDWARDSRALDALIRGLMPEPGARTRFGARTIKVVEAVQEEGGEDRAPGAPPGAVLALDRDNGMLISTGRGCLWLRRVQPESRRVMGALEFARGHHIRPGDTFG
jgi:methionyl-tRNA formyltransferase